MRLTWFGHSCFRIEVGGSIVLIDPFLTGNPVFEAAGLKPADAAKGVTNVVLTHGHDDHVGDAVSICKEQGATLTAVYELAMWLNAQGVEKVDPCNPGGTMVHGAFDVSYVKAFHSSSTMADGKPVYLGNPCGVVLRSKGGKTVYHMGDTEIFGDMALINEIFEPKIGIVPIGDRFTMGARTAAMACRKFFNFDMVIPCHYGTFPIIDQTPEKFLSEARDQKVVIPKVGELIEV